MTDLYDFDVINCSRVLCGCVEIPGIRELVRKCGRKSLAGRVMYAEAWHQLPKKLIGGAYGILIHTFNPDAKEKGEYVNVGRVMIPRQSRRIITENENLF
jgi:hypothetical protein